MLAGVLLLNFAFSYGDDNSLLCPVWCESEFETEADKCASVSCAGCCADTAADASNCAAVFPNVQRSAACADGWAEVVFVEGKVVGCDSRWTSPGICHGASACGEGFHICTDNAEAEAKGLTAELCSDLPPAGTLFLSLQSSTGGWACLPAGQGTDDIWGCGKKSEAAAFEHAQCGAFNIVFGNSPNEYQRGTFSSTIHTNELGTISHSGCDGGVLCCKGPAEETCTDIATSLVNIATSFSPALFVLHVL